jgi:hypothetical protein
MRICATEFFNDATSKLAASELKSLVKRAKAELFFSDLKINLKIYQQDGYCVRREGNKLIFEGEKSIDVLYAVYEFAEKVLGYCFYEPGKDLLEKKERIELNQGLIIGPSKPMMTNRGLVQEFAFTEKSYDLADWMVKNRLNYLLTHMCFYETLSPSMKSFYHIRGITIESGHHSFNYWIPAKKYYKSNPEYFAIIGNNRVVPKIDDTYIHGGQLCVTNQSLREQIAANMIEYCQKNPEVSTISLAPNDGFGWCECNQCSSLYDKSQKGEWASLSEHVYKAQTLYHDLVTDIAGRIKNTLPQTQLTLMAYINYLEPASGFRLKDNIAVHFAPYWRCVNHKIYDPQCPINSHYAQALRKWQNAKAGGKINIYEYYMGVNLYVSFPLVHHEDIFDEVAFYHNNGVDGLMTQFRFTHWQVYGLNYYMMTKALWNEDKSEIKRVLRLLYGENADHVQRFYSLLKNLCGHGQRCHITYPRAILRRTDINQYEQLYKLASELTKCDYRQGLILWTEYMMRFKRLFDGYNAGTDITKGIGGFVSWAREHKDEGVFDIEMVEKLMSKWLERAENGSAWYHCNIDWEDAYIRKHDSLLG